MSANGLKGRRETALERRKKNLMDYRRDLDTSKDADEKESIKRLIAICEKDVENLNKKLVG